MQLMVLSVRLSFRLPNSPEKSSTTITYSFSQQTLCAGLCCARAGMGLQK